MHLSPFLQAFSRGKKAGSPGLKGDVAPMHAAFVDDDRNMEGQEGVLWVRCCRLVVRMNGQANYGQGNRCIIQAAPKTGHNRLTLMARGKKAGSPRFGLCVLCTELAVRRH